jgi:hypothetical protein
MNDVVGLRFVVEGAQETLAALRKYEQVNTEVASTVQRSVAAFAGMESRLRSLQRNLEQGRIGSGIYAESLREIKRQFAELSGQSIQKASAEVERFNRLLREQDTAKGDDSARRGYESLVASLDPAAAAVQRFEQAMQTLNAAQERGVVTAREYSETQGRLLERLNASRVAADTAARQGFDRLAASLDPLLAATQRYEQRLATVREAEARGQVTVTEAARARERIQMAYDKEVAKLNGVESAQLRAQRAEQEAVRTKQQAERAYSQLLARIDPVVAAQQRFAAAQITVDNAIKAGTITKRQGIQTMEAYRASMNVMERAALQTTTATSKVRQQFLATANTIAILDGPLGGIASRFSAFGILIGRTGLLVGGLLVSVAALGAILNRGVRAFVEWEAANARVNAILEVTGNQVGMTTAEIRNLTSQIALGTLESEQSIQSAAAKLLTFRNIAGDVFGDVLRAATDMAALGFGTVESETVKLAKALEDPAQALTSLSRAGIVFTRQQRQVIIALAESGRQAEAMERILGNVNARVGGAAEAAARDTLAGAFDTISQATGRAVRDFAQFVLETSKLDQAIKDLGGSLADYAGGPGTTEQQIERLERTIKEYQEIESSLEGFATRARRTFSPVTPSPTAFLQISPQEAAEKRAEAERDLAAARERLRVEQQTAAAARARQMVSRDVEALDNLAVETDLRRELLGLTEDEQRLQRNLAQLGLRNLDIEQRVAAYEAQLRAAGQSQAVINELTDAYRDKLRGVAAEIERAGATTAMERQTRAIMSNTTNLNQQVELMHAQVAALQAGASVSEAREQAEAAILRTMVDTLLKTEDLPEAVRKVIEEFKIAEGQVRRVKEQLTEAQKFTDMRTGIDATIEGLEKENQLLELQLDALESGVDFTDSRRYAEIALQRVFIENLRLEKQITDEKAEQLNSTLDMLLARGVELQTRVESFRLALREANETISRRDTIRAENALLTEQLNLNRAGLSLADARAQAERNIEDRMIARQLAAANLTNTDRVNLLQLQQSLRLNRLILGIVERRRAAEEQAEAERRGLEQGRERLAQMQAENLLADAVLRFGEQSVDVETVRNRQARDALGLFIQQNLLQGAIVNHLRAQLAESQKLARQQRQLNELRQAAGTIVQDVEHQRQMIDLLQQGYSIEQAQAELARRKLVTDLESLEAMAATAMNAAVFNIEVYEVAKAIWEAARAALEMADHYDRAAKAANMRTELQGNLDSLDETLEVLDKQLEMLEQGEDFIVAQRLAAVEVQRARATALLTEQGITAELGTQLALLNAMFDDMGDRVRAIADREARVATFRPARGGGGSSREEVTLQDLRTQLLREQAIRKELLGLSGEELRIREVYYDLVNRLGDAQANYTEDQITGIARLIAEQSRLNDETERQQRLSEQIGDTLGNLFISAIGGANAFKSALAGVLRNLASMLANNAFRALMAPGGPGSGATTMLGALFGALTGAATGGAAPVPSAKGNVFSGGAVTPFANGAVIANFNRAPGANVVPFANGGVVGSPTLFPMRGGQTGLMGEAGPEAIMPLRRGRDGKLGVASKPQEVQVDVRVHMDADGNWQASVERIADKRVQRAAPSLVRQSVSATYAASTERRMR